MFEIESVEKTSLSENIKDIYMIPYMLSGSSIFHDQGYKGESVRVAVIDTGADYTHEALIDNIKDTSQQTVGYQDTCMDDDGHGTGVASTIIEIAPNCEILPIKALSPMYGNNTDVIEAVRIAIDQDVDVINMSISGTFSKTSEYESFHALIKEAQEKNIFICVASGNTGEETTLYPACFEEVTTVGAVDLNQNEALFSTESSHVDVCQVGVDLVEAKLGGGYTLMSGTSMATPMVSGLATLLIQKYKEQHDGEKPDGSLINKMLKLFAVDLGIAGLDSKTGAGFISFNPSASIIKMESGSTTYYVNGEAFEAPVAPMLIDDKYTMVYIRSANHGKTFVWDKESPYEFTFV